MKCDVVVDLQFGSTAKGKLCQYLAMNRKYDFSIRVQSIQAGHTVIRDGIEYKMQTIPCAWVNPNVMLILGPGCFIEKNQLLKEIGWIEQAGISVRDRLILDYRATYITEEDKAEERANRLTESMGSTSEGAGASLIRKLWRKGGVVQVKDDMWAVKNRLMEADTLEIIQKADVLLEGCQGTLLGVHTTPYYPYCTSRECSVSAILGEAGIAPFDVRSVYGVFRTFPIRVGGNSGKTGARELSWEDVAAYSGDPTLVPERTTVTNRQRRIFEFSVRDMLQAMMINKPDILVCNFINYLNHDDTDVTTWSKLSTKSKRWISQKEQILKQNFQMLGTGKNPNSWIIR